MRAGPDYDRHKQKAPSAAPLYEAFAVDVFCANSRIDHVAARMRLPPALCEVVTNHGSVPPVLVVQIQMPSDSPPLLGTIDDGPGWAIVMYFKISQVSY